MPFAILGWDWAAVLHTSPAIATTARHFGAIANRERTVDPIERFTSYNSLTIFPDLYSLQPCITNTQYTFDGTH